jgi:hypothetical protein
MSCPCVTCGREVTGEAGLDPRIVVPFDLDGGQVGTLVFGKCCASLAPSGRALRDAQFFLNYTASTKRRAAR